MLELIYPPSRIESLLAKAIGEEEAMPAPEWLDVPRLEAYLTVLTGGEADLPEYPMSNIEKFLAYKCGQTDVELPTPITRIEKFLAKDTPAEPKEMPEPQTRIEQYLYEWEPGGGGVLLTYTGNLPATITAVAHALASLTRYGLCTQDGTPTPDAPVDIMCNNGALKMVDDELPATYKRVLGFSCDNNAMWEITGFKLKGSDTVRISFSVNAACNVWGCYQGADATDNYDLYASTNSGAKYFRYGSGTYLSYWSPDDLGERFDVVYTPNGSQGMPQDSTWSPLTFTSANNLLIGSTTLTGTSAKLKGNIYGNFVVDGRLHLIPCERVSDNVLGYYDTYTATFHEPYEGFDGAVSLGYDGSHCSITADGAPEVLTVYCQNLVDLSAVTNGYYYDPNGVLTEAPATRLSDYIPVKAGQKYTVYVKSARVGAAANVRCNLFNSVQEWMAQSAFVVRDEAVSTITPTENGYLRVSANYAGTGARVDWSTLQIVRGEYTLATMPPYEPYVTPQTASVPMLLSVGDYKDEVELIHGPLTHRIGIMVFDGTEDWRPSSSGGNIYILTSAVGVNLEAICTHFKKVLNSMSSVNMPNGSFRGHPSLTVLYFKDEAAENVAAFKARLSAQYAAGKPVIMPYVLATETTEQTTPNHLVTHNGVNVIDSVANVEPIEAKIEYYGTESPMLGMMMPTPSAQEEPADEPQDEPQEPNTEEPAEPTEEER